MNGMYNLFRLLFSNKPRYIYAGLRRRFLYYFRKDYCNAQLARKKGVCSGEGYCCRIVLPWCSYFKEERCLLYPCQPLFCKLFPIDEKDKELSDVKEACSYYFEK